MPDQGRYEKVPRPESIEKFVKYLQSSNAVKAVVRESDQLLIVERVKHPPLRVFMTNVYIVGLADVYDISTQAGEVDAIVTMSEWNGYTAEAKASCKERNIGLFKFREFLGAIYYDGEQYFDYIPPDQRQLRQRRNQRG